MFKMKCLPSFLQIRVARGADGRAAGAGERPRVPPELGGGGEVTHGGGGGGAARGERPPAGGVGDLAAAAQALHRVVLPDHRQERIMRGLCYV